MRGFKIEKTIDAIIVWRYDGYKKQWVEFQHLDNQFVINFEQIIIKRKRKNE